MSLRQDLTYARRIRAGGGRYAMRIVTEAHRAGIQVSLGLALVEQESDFRNVFGCDLGSRSSVPFCHQAVTRSRVRELVAHNARGGTSNGVGLTQLTSAGYILEAERLGGAHLPKYQLRVGFRILRGEIDALGERRGVGAYNGGRGNPQMGYAAEVLARRDRWYRILTR